MLRSLYSGISGMKVNQTKMDVIGNNISNVGTTGFKSGRVRFQDMLSQSVTEAMAPMANQGGVNASQVGLGVQLAGIDTIMTQGAMQPTGRNLDLAVDGDGFFLVGKGPSMFQDNTLEVNQEAGAHNIVGDSLSKSNMDMMYTREGSFTVDNDGNLLTSDGYRVMGYSVTNDSTTQSASALQPNMVSAGGFDFRFGPGSALNGYKVVLGKIGPDTTASATVNKDNKTIILNGDFSKADGITSLQATSAINKALDTAGIAQTVLVTGNSTVISGLSSANNVSGGADATKPGSVSAGGFTIAFTAGSGLNGYSIELGNVSDSTNPPAAGIDTVNKKIILNGDFTSGSPIGAIAVKNELNALLSANNFTQTVDSVSGAAMNLTQSSAATDSNGDAAATTAPKDITVAGFTFSFPKGTAYNGVTIKIGQIDWKPTAPATNTVQVQDNTSATPPTILIDGDFITPNAVKLADLQSAMAALTVPGITVTGSPRNYTGISSSSIDGGADLVAPGNTTAMGLTFGFTAGSALNGYSIQIGNITAGTKTSADVDTNNKKIIINGDFVTAGAATSNSIMNSINNALVSKGITQGVSVTGTPTILSNTESNLTDGGTPVQSLDNNGILNFVDGTKTVKAFDGSLKTLRIPDTVKIPGEDTALRVKTFSISKDGIISAVLEDGRVAALGQLAMASFKNPEGLTKLGKNLYHQSVNSGTASFKSGVGTNGEDNSKGYGDMLEGMLEMSNVDLAEQFTDMIVTSRAFQASGKMISTGDEILQDIINLKR